VSAGPRRTWRARAVQALVLLVGFALMALAQTGIPHTAGALDAVSGLGFLLLAGTLMSELLEVVGLPHLSGYLLAGIVAGPHVLHLVDHPTVERLGVVNTLALALIALAGGAELRLESLRRVWKSLGWATLMQMTLVMAVTGGVFLALSPFIPFMQALPLGSAAMVALVWGALATSRSPAAVLGVMSQLRPKGPLSEFTVAFVMLSDVVVIVVVALVVALAKLVLDPSATLQPAAFSALGRELLGSAALGTTLGIILAVYLRLSGRQLLLVLLLLGFGLTALLDYVHLDPLLSFMVAGFVVQNFSSGGEKLLTAVEQTGAVVFVIFFATAGAHLDLSLLGQVWATALVLVAARAFATWGAVRASSALAKDEPVVARWGWSGLVSQAGLTFALTILIQRAIPELDASFATLAIGVVAVNEVLGPVLFKLGLDRAGESRPAA
jgi:Kef-type K+ transport system membrane component KefB